MPLLDSDLRHGRVIFPALNKQGEDFSFLQKKKKKKQIADDDTEWHCGRGRSTGTASSYDDSADRDPLAETTTLNCSGPVLGPIYIGKQTRPKPGWQIV